MDIIAENAKIALSTEEKVTIDEINSICRKRQKITC